MFSQSNILRSLSGGKQASRILARDRLRGASPSLDLYKVDRSLDDRSKWCGASEVHNRCHSSPMTWLSGVSAFVGLIRVWSTHMFPTFL
jgi:hypothetical protein